MHCQENLLKQNWKFHNFPIFTISSTKKRIFQHNWLSVSPFNSGFFLIMNTHSTKGPPDAISLVYVWQWKKSKASHKDSLHHSTVPDKETPVAVGKSIMMRQNFRGELFALDKKQPESVSWFISSVYGSIISIRIRKDVN